MRILITGGTGYIGTHTCVELLNAGHDVTVFDNFSNSRPTVLAQVDKICGKEPHLTQGDIRNAGQVLTALVASGAEAVIHMAALKAVGEAEQKPLEYHDVNVHGTGVLLSAMKNAGVPLLLFSSSAAVYKSSVFPRHELDAAEPSGVYGQTKLHAEQLIQSYAASRGKLFQYGILRYFNPIGAHESGLLGEEPLKPQGLMPALLAAKAGKKTFVLNCHDMKNGPVSHNVCHRDYVHVMDLAGAHVKAVARLRSFASSFVVNVGSGIESSVLDVVSAVEQLDPPGPLALTLAAGRRGDVPVSIAETNRADKLLGWTARKSLQQGCEDAWKHYKLREMTR